MRDGGAALKGETPGDLLAERVLQLLFRHVGAAFDAPALRLGIQLVLGLTARAGATGPLAAALLGRHIVRRGSARLLGLTRLGTILVDRTSSDLLRAVLAFPAVLRRGLDVLVLALSLLAPLLRHPCLLDCLRPTLQGHDQVAYGPTRVNARHSMPKPYHRAAVGTRKPVIGIVTGEGRGLWVSHGSNRWSGVHPVARAEFGARPFPRRTCFACRQRGASAVTRPRCPRSVRACIACSPLGRTAL